MEQETKQIDENIGNESNEKKGWSWLGFLFTPFYYAGYGKLQKGFILSLISAIPLLGLGVYIYGGLKAKKELPIGKIDFSWGNVWKLIGIWIAIMVVIFAIVYGISSSSNTTPKCGDESVKAKLIEMSKEELVKQNMGELLASIKFDIVDIRTDSHNEENDTYECKANLLMQGEKTASIPFSYTVSTLDNGSFYVEIHNIATPNNSVPQEVAPSSTNSNVKLTTGNYEGIIGEEVLLMSFNTAEGNLQLLPDEKGYIGDSIDLVEGQQYTIQYEKRTVDHPMGKMELDVVVSIEK